MFPRNFWYVVAWSRELEGRSLLRRIIANEPLVLYRTASGAPVALEDRCCHRHMPLSSGRLKGDNLECGYHGLVYDPSGACIEIPSQKHIPPNARVRSFPVQDRHGWVWAWMGEPALADPAAIPDFHWEDDPGWRFKGELLPVPANYQLLIDNLLDLTHVQYVHPTTLGTDAVAGSPVTVKREENLIRVSRWVIDKPAPPFYQKAGGFRPDQHVDRWQLIEFRPPSFVWLDVGCALTGTGAPEGNRSRGISLRNHSIVTPETERTSHYFWTEGHNFSIEDAQLTEMLFQQIHIAFMEDLVILRAQDDNLHAMGQRDQLNLYQDAGGLQARRIIEGILKSERLAPAEAS